VLRLIFEIQSNSILFSFDLKLHTKQDRQVINHAFIQKTKCGPKETTKFCVHQHILAPMKFVMQKRMSQIWHQLPPNGWIESQLTPSPHNHTHSTPSNNPQSKCKPNSIACRVVNIKFFVKCAFLSK
jgi:hypothetical protein